MDRETEGWAHRRMDGQVVRHTDRQTIGQADGWTDMDGCLDGQVVRQTDGHTIGQADGWWMGRPTVKQMHGWTDIQKDGQSDGQGDKCASRWSDGQTQMN